MFCSSFVTLKINGATHSEYDNVSVFVFFFISPFYEKKKSCLLLISGYPKLSISARIEGMKKSNNNNNNRMNERKYHLLNFKSNSSIVSEKHIVHSFHSHRLFSRSNFLLFSFERINAFHEEIKFVP